MRPVNPQPSGEGSKPDDESAGEDAQQAGVKNELNEFMKSLNLSEDRGETDSAIGKLSSEAAAENPVIGNIKSPAWVVKVLGVPLIVGFALKILFSEVPKGWESCTVWLADGGVLVSAGATVVAYFGWKCKKYLAMIQLKIDALDIWEKYHEVRDDGKEAVRKLRTAYLLKKSYINTITWGLSGVTIVAALISVLIANV